MHFREKGYRFYLYILQCSRMCMFICITDVEKRLLIIITPSILLLDFIVILQHPIKLFEMYWKNFRNSIIPIFPILRSHG